MMQNRQIPKGYKDSPLGIIPESWEVKRIKDFGRIVTGNTPSTTQPDNYGYEYMFVGPADLSFEKYITTTEKMLSRQGFSQSRKMPEGTVLFTCIGSTIGKSGIASTTLTSNQQINAVICNCESSNEFLYYELNFRSGKIKSLAGEQAVPIINKTDFENIKVIFPPLPEQQKIAEILSIWDETIEKQTQLVARLETRKYTIRRQLLINRGKMPKGYDCNWQHYRLGEIVKIKKGIQLNKLRLDPSNYYPVINGGVEPSGYHSEYNTPANTITISEGGNSCGFVNLITTEFWSGGHCYTLTEKDFVSKRFLFHLLKSMEPSIMSLRVGSGLPNIQMNSLIKLIVTIPSTIEKQTAIANILSEADNEIDLAKQKLAKLKEQKKGLMQVLLTGKKRVTV